MDSNSYFFSQKIHSNIDVLEIKQIVDCQSACKTCFEKCMKKGYRDLGLLCLECAEIAELAVKFKCSHAILESDVMKLFALACRKCLSECKRVKFTEAKNMI